MGSLDAYIHYENLILLKKQLADPRTTDKQRQILQKLLTEEEAKSCRAMMVGPQPKKARHDQF